jgi:hypothetical protein
MHCRTQLDERCCFAVALQRGSNSDEQSSWGSAHGGCMADVYNHMSRQQCQRTRHRLSRSPSRWKDMTSAPMMEAQVLSVMMFFTTGEDCPCTVTRLAIWMTGSLSGSGKWPCRGDHNMSNAPLVHQHAGRGGAWRAHGVYSLGTIPHSQCTLFRQSLEQQLSAACNCEAPLDFKQRQASRCQ